MFVEIAKILPKMSYVKEKIIVKRNGNTIQVYYVNKYKNNKLKSDRFQPAKTELKNKIELSRNLVEAMGLYFGDGQTAKTSKSYQAVRFANYEPCTIIKFLVALDELGVERKNLKAGLNVSMSITNKNLDGFRKGIVNYWHKITKIPKTNFYKINWLNNFSTKALKGNITLILSNSSFRLVFDSLYGYVKTLATKDKNIAAQFLRGIIASDGTVYFGKHRELIVAAKENAARSYIKQLLRAIGIVPNKDGLITGKEMVRITGYTNMRLAKQYDLCEIHSEKRNKFEKLWLSYKVPSYRKGVGVNLVLRTLKAPKSVSNLALELGRKENAIRRYLYMLEKLGKVRRQPTIKTAKIGRRAEIWSTK